MALYTLVPAEEVMPRQDTARHLERIERDGRVLVVRPAGNGTAIIVRLSSTNPEDYLNPRLRPGQLIDLQ